MRGTLTLLSLLALLCGCSARPSSPVLANGSCRCGSGRLCVSEVSTSSAKPVACRETLAGCAAFAGIDGTCWPSPDVAGLCLCTRGGAIADAK